MAKKKIEEQQSLTEELLPVEQPDTNTMTRESPPADGDMDLNELLESLDTPDQDSIAENPPTGESVFDDVSSNEAPLDADGADETSEANPLTFENEPIDDQPAEGIPDEEPEPVKPKRTTKKKKAATELASNSASENVPTDEIAPESIPTKEKPTPARRSTKASGGILTLEARADVETQESIEDTIWHEIHNAYRTRRMLTGMLGGLEQTDNGKTVAVVDYKGFRIIIPLKEMVMNFPNNLSGNAYSEMVVRHHKILSNMLGAEIDFVVKGIDSKTRSAVASRKEAMLKKRQLFYLNTDAAGMYRIYDGRIIQARVLAVAEKVIRIEAFGVECSIMARDLSWDWIGDARDRFSVGDQVLVRVLAVTRNSLEDISIKADVKSVSENNNFDNLKKCRIQSKYAGKVTDVHKGVVYIRLTNGVNAIAHSCYDRRMPGKKDDVSFAVTHIDEERGVAMGIITRIIKQNL